MKTNTCEAVVLYDSLCGFCRTWAERLRGTLARRGIGMEPLPTDWHWKEMKLQWADGSMIGGADVFVTVARRLWWAWPLWAVSRLPGVLPVLRVIYRWVAANRYCLNARCGIKARQAVGLIRETHPRPSKEGSRGIDADKTCSRSVSFGGSDCIRAANLPRLKPILIGGVVWLAFCLVPLDPNFGIGTIEKLFLLGPLVVVPLGLELLGAPACAAEAAVARRRPGGRALPAALLVVVSFLVPQGKWAGMMTLPWLGLVAWFALDGLRRWRSAPAEVCRNVAVLMLPVGAVGLLQSRWGMEPLGFREPLVLLVAVHFHFAAFVTPLMASRVVRKNWPVALLACVGSPLLAAGYVLHTGWLRLTGAMMLVVGLVVVSLLIARKLPKIRPRLAQGLLAVAALSVWYAMTYAAVYAVADYCGEVWVAIPQMARTHGVVNALGFSVCGLLGWWMVERYQHHPAPHLNPLPDMRRGEETGL